MGKEYDTWTIFWNWLWGNSVSSRRAYYFIRKHFNRKERTLLKRLGISDYLENKVEDVLRVWVTGDRRRFMPKNSTLYWTWRDEKRRQVNPDGTQNLIPATVINGKDIAKVYTEWMEGTEQEQVESERVLSEFFDTIELKFIRKWFELREEQTALDNKLRQLITGDRRKYTCMYSTLYLEYVREKTLERLNKEEQWLRHQYQTPGVTRP